MTNRFEIPDEAAERTVMEKKSYIFLTSFADGLPYQMAVSTLLAVMGHVLTKSDDLKHDVQEIVDALRVFEKMRNAS